MQIWVKVLVYYIFKSENIKGILEKKAFCKKSNYVFFMLLWTFLYEHVNRELKYTRIV